MSDVTRTDDKPEDSGKASQQSQDRVRDAAAQLYAGVLSEFITTRTGLVKTAKAEGHKEAATEIAALRKPSVAAWLLNQVVHQRDPVLAALTDLGARLRQATARLDAPAIAGLRAERDTVLADLVTAVATVGGEAGQAVSAAVESEVRNTGIAALADEAAEAVLTSGTLTRALSYSGFGEVDLSEAAATTSTGVVLTSIRGGRSQAQAADTEEADETDEDSPDNEWEGEAAEPDGNDPADSEDGAESLAEDGAEALAEAAAAAERERRLAQAEESVATAEKEIGRRRSAVEAARNRTEATRQRIQKLQDQLEQARAEDDEALGRLTDAVGAAKLAATDLEAAREHLANLLSDGPASAE